MLPAAKLGPGSLLMVWIILCAGLMMGAHVGYNATTADNATVDYNAETGVLTAGNETSDVYNTSGAEQSHPDNPILSERGERWLGDNGQSESVIADSVPIPEAISQRAEETSLSYTNQTIDAAFSLAAYSGDPAAAVVYEYREHVSWDTIRVLLFVVTLAPPIAAFYAAAKQL